MAEGIAKYLRSSVGKKYLMSVTGLGWSLFVLTHMLGNLLIFAGPEMYNKYSHALTSNPLIFVAEGGLVLLLLVHIFNAFSLKIRNWNAKPQLYAVTPKGPKGASLSSRTMIYTGSIILVFLISHLITFKYGQHYSVNYGGVEMRDIHRLVMEVFQNPFYVAWYWLCLVFVGVHLFHGVASGFQTLGINHPRFNNGIKNFGYVYSIAVVAGFISQPLYVLIAGK